MATEISRSTRLIGILGTVLVIGAAYGLAQKSEPEASRQPDDKLAALLIEGDADTPLDTIRRLHQNAKSAVEKAQSTDTKVDQFAKATQSKLESLTALLTSIRQDSQTHVESEVGGLKSEMRNFMDLIEGRIQIRQPPLYTQQDGAALDEWIEIPPRNAPSFQFYSAQGVGSNPGSTDYAVNNGFLLDQPGRAGTAETDAGITPVATIPVNSPLLNSVTLSTLIGRVPKGGQVFEPFNFYVQTGMDNLTSQDHEIPYLSRAIWRGVATGDKDLECIRGALVSVTFVFTDETIQTIEGSRDDPLAELVTTTGSNCVPGTYVSNTGKYIAMYGLGGGLAGLGQAIAENETISSFTANGNLLRSVNGDTGNFLAGRSLSASAAKAAEIIDDEYRDSFSSVVLESGVAVNLVALRQMDIDHNLRGRKVRYVEAD